MKQPGAARTEKAFKTSRANANSIVGRDFRPNHTERGAIASPRALNGLCDDEGVPLICPTCQVLTQGVLTGDGLLLCMGLFSIFLVGSHRDALRDIPLEAAHASEAFGRFELLAPDSSVPVQSICFVLTLQETAQQMFP
jgi:hypothetical protein